MISVLSRNTVTYIAIRLRIRGSFVIILYEYTELEIHSYRLKGVTP